MTNPNDPVFPLDLRDSKDLDHVMHVLPGLTKREYFAAQILPSIVVWDAIMNRNHPSDGGKKENLIPVAVEMADALIKELSK